jgi:hypothetical protein
VAGANLSCALALSIPQPTPPDANPAQQLTRSARVVEMAPGVMRSATMVGRSMGQPIRAPGKKREWGIWQDYHVKEPWAEVTCAFAQMIRDDAGVCFMKQVICLFKQMTCFIKQMTRFIEQVLCLMEQATCFIGQVSCFIEQVTCFMEQMTCFIEQMLQTKPHVTTSRGDTARGSVVGGDLIRRRTLRAETLGFVGRCRGYPPRDPRRRSLRL